VHKCPRCSGCLCALQSAALASLELLGAAYTIRTADFMLIGASGLLLTLPCCELASFNHAGCHIVVMTALSSQVMLTAVRWSVTQQMCTTDISDGTAHTVRSFKQRYASEAEVDGGGPE
jgi:hypothetical protein